MSSLLHWSLFWFILVQTLLSFESLMITDRRPLSQKFSNNNLKDALNNLRKRKQVFLNSNGQDILDLYNFPKDLRTKSIYLMDEKNLMEKEKKKKTPNVSSKFETNLMNPEDYHYYRKLTLPLEMPNESSFDNNYSDPKIDKNSEFAEVKKWNKNDKRLPQDTLVKQKKIPRLKNPKSNFEVEKVEDNSLIGLGDLSEAIFESEKEISDPISNSNDEISKENVSQIKKHEKTESENFYQNSFKDLGDELNSKSKRLKSRNTYLDGYRGVSKDEVLNKIKSLFREKNFRQNEKRVNFDELDELAQEIEENKKIQPIQNAASNDNKDPIQDITSNPSLDTDQWVFDEANKNLIMSLSMIRKKRFIDLLNDEKAIKRLQIPQNNELKKIMNLNNLEKNNSNQTKNKNHLTLYNYDTFLRSIGKDKRSISSNLQNDLEITKENDGEGVNENKFHDLVDPINPMLLNNEALIVEAVELIQKDNKKKSYSPDVQKKFEKKINLAYDLDDIRSALGEFHQSLHKKSAENEHGAEKLYPIKKFSNLKKKDPQDCSSLQLMTTECSFIKEIIPKGRTQKLFTEACNWHQICYTCGEIYNLSPRDCESGFLQQTLLACNGLESCQSAAELILMTLLESKSFYKTKVFKTCYRVDCVREYLIGYKKR